MYHTEALVEYGYFLPIHIISHSRSMLINESQPLKWARAFAMYLVEQQIATGVYFTKPSQAEVPWLWECTKLINGKNAAPRRTPVPISWHTDPSEREPESDAEERLKTWRTEPLPDALFAHLARNALFGSTRSGHPDSPCVLSWSLTGLTPPADVPAADVPATPERTNGCLLHDSTGALARGSCSSYDLVLAHQQRNYHQ
jgi:hypothetical protein